MSATDWNAPVRLAEIGQGIRRELAAGPADRARVAESLGLAELSRLEGSVEIAPQGRGWRLTGTVRADAVQTCGVTLEPLPVVVDERFQVDLMEAGDPHLPPAPEEFTLETIDTPDAVEGGAFRPGAYLEEHLALALDPFPRKPGAVFEPPAAEPEPSPFAVLSRLKPRDGEG